MLKRDLQKMAVKKLGKSDPEKIYYYVKKLFPEHLLRAIKFDLRNENQVIYDNYIATPDDESLDLKDICDIFLKNKISSYPKLDLFYITNPWGQHRENHFNYEFYKNYYQILEKIWMTCGEENISNDLQSFDLKKIIDRSYADSEKLLGLKQKIQTNNFTENDLELIKYGYMGVGLHYFLGMKNNEDVDEFTNLLKNYHKTEIR